MNVRLCRDIVRFRWKTALLVWIGTVTAIALATGLGTRQYTAAAAVLVEPGAQGAGSAAVALPANQIATEVAVAGSERVASHVIRKLALQDDTRWRALWERSTAGIGSFEAWLSGQLLKRLEIRPTHQANVLTISYTSADPAMAATIANTFTQAYLDVAAELRRESAREYSASIAESARQLRAELEAPQQAGASALDQAGGRSAGRETAAQLVAAMSLREEQAALEREAEIAQRSFEVAVGRSGQTLLAIGGSHRHLSVLQSAAPPLLPSGPHTSLLLAGGGVLGLVLAVLAALLRESSDKRLRMTVDLPRLLGVRVIGLLEDSGPGFSRQARIPAG